MKTWICGLVLIGLVWGGWIFAERRPNASSRTLEEGVVDTKVGERVQKAVEAEAAAQKERDRLEAELKPVKEKAKALKGRMEEINRQLKNVTADSADASRKRAALYGQLAAVQDEAEALKPKLEKIQEDFNTARTNWKRANEELVAQHNERARVASDVGGKVRALEGQIRRLGLLGDFDRLHSSILDTAGKLEALERMIDKAMLGKYMREKFSRLLTSDAFCKAASEGCKQTADKRPEPNLDPIFFGKDNKLGKAESPAAGSSSATH